MSDRIPGLRGEFLWELDIARMQLTALAGAMPEEYFEWRPAADARSFSQVLVHIATANLGLLEMAGMGRAEERELYGAPAGDDMVRITAMVRTNLSLERSVTAKSEVTALLERSFEAVRQTFTAADEPELERTQQFFGEPTTVRRVYLRMLAHTHEHMGQAIAYVRMSGMKVPWPDPLKDLPL
jgi:uncharacterized damage-inducible protein DinB